MDTCKNNSQDFLSQIYRYLNAKPATDDSDLRQLARNIFAIIKQFSASQREEIFDMIPLRQIEIKSEARISLPVLEGASSSIQVSSVNFYRPQEPICTVEI